LHKMLDDATDADMESARNDLVKFDAGLAAIPLAGIPRHARRALAAQDGAITQDTIAFLRELWRRYDARAVFLAMSTEWTGRGRAAVTDSASRRQPPKSC